MHIQVEGGHLESIGQYTTRTDTGLVPMHIWRAVSDHAEIVPCEPFLTRGLAEYYLWVTDERIRGRIMRLGH